MNSSEPRICAVGPSGGLGASSWADGEEEDRVLLPPRVGLERRGKQHPVLLLSERASRLQTPSPEKPNF